MSNCFVRKIHFHSPFETINQNHLLRVDLFIYHNKSAVTPEYLALNRTLH